MNYFLASLITFAAVWVATMFAVAGVRSDREEQREEEALRRSYYGEK